MIRLHLIFLMNFINLLNNFFQLIAFQLITQEAPQFSFELKNTFKRRKFMKTFKWALALLVTSVFGTSLISKI